MDEQLGQVLAYLQSHGFEDAVNAVLAQQAGQQSQQQRVTGGALR
jgi:hypothetical protein